MAKIMIIYDSLGGNTEKMAHAIAEGIEQVKGVEATVKKVDCASIKDLQNADGIVMGSPTYYGQMSGKLKEFIDRSVKVHGGLEGKVGAAFTSSGGTATGAETTLLSIVQAMLVHGMIIQGRSDDKHYGAAVVGAPKRKDLEQCMSLGKRVACLAVKLRFEGVNSPIRGRRKTKVPKDERKS